MAPPPKWVKSFEEPSAGAFENNGTEGESFILLEEQQHAGTGEVYTHVVKKITSQSGVQDGAKVHFSFDPTYQRLDLNFIVLRRGDKIYDRLEPEKIKVFQQETELERHQYNGTLSAVLFVEDVRVGDILEYGWTIRGSNPVMGGHFIHSFLVDWSVPVQKQVYRVLWPAEKKLIVKQHQTEVRPEVTHLEGVDDYTWEIKRRTPVVVEDTTPLGYNPFGWIQLTEFSSWKDVVEWALPLYVSTKPLPDELRQKIAAWRLAGEPEDQVQAALRFVQDEVRYLGMEIGPGSHRPSEPGVVFARRFGDCKDKVSLFCTMLHEMGIEAHPVLVHTSRRQHLDEWAPSPYAFNHVVALVKVNGNNIWVDPTRSFQRGHLKDLYFPDYARGLIIKPGTTDLCLIPAPKAGLPKTTVNESFNIKSYNSPIQYEVTTTYEGLSADHMRASFSNSRREELEKTLLNQSAKRYPKIKMTRPMESQDDQQRNIFILIEHYEVKDIYELSDDTRKWSTWFYPDEILPFVKRPETSFRSMPLGIVHPWHYVQNTEIRLPQDYNLQNETKQVEEKALRFERQVNYTNRLLRLHYELESLADEVPTKEVPEHLENLKKIRAVVGYGIQHPNVTPDAPKPAEPFQVNWSILAMAGMYFVLATVAAVIAHHYRPQYHANEPPLIIHELKGIGGWLIVLTIILCLKPIIYAVFLLKHAGVYFTLSSWSILTTPGNAHYDPLWAPLLIFEVLGNLTMLVFSVLILVLFFQNRFAFPRFFMLFLVLSVIMVTLDEVGAGLIPKAHGGPAVSGVALFRTLFHSIVWILYVVRSQRVKLTFVE